MNEDDRPDIQVGGAMPPHLFVDNWEKCAGVRKIGSGENDPSFNCRPLVKPRGCSHNTFNQLFGSEGVASYFFPCQGLYFVVAATLIVKAIQSELCSLNWSKINQAFRTWMRFVMAWRHFPFSSSKEKWRPCLLICTRLQAENWTKWKWSKMALFKNGIISLYLKN